MAFHMRRAVGSGWIHR